MAVRGNAEETGVRHEGAGQNYEAPEAGSGGGAAPGGGYNVVDDTGSGGNEGIQTIGADQVQPTEQPASQVREQPTIQRTQQVQPQQQAVSQLSAKDVTQAARPQQQTQAQEHKPAMQQQAVASGGYEAPQREQQLADLSLGSEYGFNIPSPSDYMKKERQKVTQAVDAAEVKATEKSAGVISEPKQESIAQTVEESETTSDPVTGHVGPFIPKRQEKISYRLPSIRTRESEKKARAEEPKKAISNKDWSGKSVYGQFTGDQSLPLDRIAIGYNYVSELMNLPDSWFIQYISKQTGVDVSELNNVYVIAEVVNNAKIPVGVFKTPDLQPESSCQLYLDISPISGITMHPMTAKKFNADFDGDAATISFSEKDIARLPDPTRFVINLAGELTYDMDFFPKYWKRGGIENPEHRSGTKEAVLQNVLYDTVPGESRDSLADKIIDVYFADKETHNEAMENFVRELSSVLTTKNGALKTDAINRILTRTYSTLKKLQLVHAADGTDRVLSDKLPPANGLNDRILYDFAEDIYNEVNVKAQGVMNFQDLKVRLCEYLGEPKGKNPSFRFTANNAKMFVNIDSRMQIRTEVEVGVDELLSGLLTYIESAKISNEISKAENAKAAKETLVEIIVANVGTPRRDPRKSTPDNPVPYSSFAEFINRFVEVYRKNAAIINAADISVLTDFKIRHGKKEVVYGIKDANPTLKDVAHALVDVYGNMGVYEIFFDLRYKRVDDKRVKSNGKERGLWREDGAYYLHAVYQSMSLRQLSQDNRMPESSESLKAIANKPLYSNGTISDDISRDMVLAIINMRTSGASNFNITLFGKDDDKIPDHSNYKETHMYRLWQTLRSIDDQLKREQQSIDWYTWINDMVQLLNTSNPDVFAYFGMDNARGFFASKYGSAMMAIARSTTNPKEISERLGSIRLAMMTEYRMSKIDAKAQKIRDASTDPSITSQKVEELYNQRRAEEAILASSSPVWRALVTEMRSDPKYRMFDRLKSSENVMGLPNLNYKAWTSWRLDNYKTVLDVLLDITLTKTEKCDIISDVVRAVTANPYIDSFEVPIQLERDNSSAYSTLPPTSVGVMDVIREFDESFDKYHKKSFKAMKKQIEDAFDMYADHAGKLDRALKFYANHPEFFVEVDEMSFADALCATLDKNYAQSEKSKQHPWTNAFFSIMSLARNHGFFSDVYRTDDRALGLVAVESVSPHDIVRVLSGESMYVYMDDGRIELLTRSTLVGDTNEMSLWKFLLDNPRFASCLRIHRACAMADVDGKGFLGASSDICDFLSRGDYIEGKDSVNAKFGGMTSKRIAQRKDRYRLYDMPTYGALVAICVPTAGRSSRTMRKSYNEVDRALRTDLSFAARNDWTADQTLEYLHLKEDDLLNAGVADDEAAKLYALLAGSVNEFMVELKETSADRADETLSGYQYETPDLQACHNYYDVRQELSGSKTAVSTGVEGCETWKLAAFIAALRPEDRYGDLRDLVDIGDVDYEGLKEKYGEQLACCHKRERDGSFTTIVKPLNEFTKEELDNGGDIVFEAPKGFTIPDKTLDSHGRQVPSACAYLIVKRDHGAEKFNLKAKKAGLDEFNSVTKHGKYFTEEEIANELSYKTDNYADLLGAINEVYNPKDQSTLFQAKMIIAQRLLEANHICGYDDMTLANCMCLADLMVVEDRGGEGLNLRSISMIARAIKSSVTYDIIDNGNVDDFHNIAVEAAKQAGEMTPVLYDVDDVVARIKVAAPMSGSPSLLRPRQSSWSRNYDLMKEITDNLGENYAMPTVAQIKKKIERVRDKFLGSPEWYSVTSIDMSNRKDRLPEADEIINRMNGYYLLGFDNAFEMIPGPSTLWIITEHTENALEVLRKAWFYGVTVIIPNEMLSDPSLEMFSRDAIVWPNSDEYSMLPMFYTRLDGSEAYPAPSKFGVYRAPVDNLVWSFEDPLNMYSLGDAGIQLFKALTDRMHVEWRDTTEIQMSNLFQNVYESHPDSSFRIRKASTGEVERILNPALQTTVDIGVARDGRNAEQHWKVVMKAIDKFRANRNKLDSEGWMTEAKPGDIVGWMAIDIFEPGSMELTKHAYAPVIPFDLKGTNDVSREAQPSKFKIKRTNLELDNIPTHTVFSLDWEYTDGIEGHNVKFFEGGTTANKFLASTDMAIEGPTIAGINIPFDAAYAPESTVSRRIGDNRRIDTLQTLMVAARAKGYNFAESEGSLPDSPILDEEQNISLKDKLLHGYVTRKEWQEAMSAPGFKWHIDQRINGFLSREIPKFFENGGNPTDYLCSEFDEEFTDMWWEFKCMFESKKAYQDGLMAFLNDMTKTRGEKPLCARSTDDSSEDYIFRCMPNDSNDPDNTHCMAVKVYFPDGQGRFFPMWVNAYAKRSFFNFNDFSGAHRINVNGSSDMLDSVATLALAGRMPKKDTWKAWMHSVMSDRGSLETPFSSIELDPRDIFISADEIEEMFSDKSELAAANSGRILGEEWGRVLALTGHRPDDLWGYDMSDDRYAEAKRRLAEYCNKNGINTIVSGMAQGFDQIGAEVALEHGLKLVCAVPFAGQESPWPKQKQDYYFRILQLADKVVYVSEPGYEGRKMHIRNEWMVDNADEVFALWNGRYTNSKGKNSGTGSCVKYARRTGKEPFVLNPESIKVTDPKDVKLTKSDVEKFSEYKSDKKYGDVFTRALKAFHPSYGTYPTNKEDVWDYVEKPLIQIIEDDHLPETDILYDIFHKGFVGEYTPFEMNMALVSLTLNDYGNDVVM